jgi:lipoprotein-anchoring transpeptidase ErfK/SrfK
MKLNLISIIVVLFLTGCAGQQEPTIGQANNSANTNIGAPSPTPTAPPQTTPERASTNVRVTMPVLDAMFADENFSGDLKSKLQLTDEQIQKLKQAARDSTANLSETDQGSTVKASRDAEDQIKSVLGADKAKQLVSFVGARWSQEEGPSNAQTATSRPNAIPTDTRIVVNAPAYRMDVFQDGKLLKTYKIGIGYPEFPLPAGMRRAQEIIFNPEWTPPDEPWVKGKFKPYEKVEAGSKLNPLGPIKIPIGLPSLIHGGKSPARLGTFASHGCVGLTDPMVQDFALLLAKISGTELSGDDVKNYQKEKDQTKKVKLGQAVPVELRYETIVVENGRLHIYRDVYEQGTNTEGNLRKVLAAYDVSLDSISDQDKSKLMDGLQQMARDAGGDPVDASDVPNKDSKNDSNTKTSAGGNKKPQDVKITRNITGKKEVFFDLAALKGKGYPAAVS